MSDDDGSSDMLIRTSRSNSSGPAKGSRMYGKISIPGASIVDGGTLTFSYSGLRRARWPGTWNAQFLEIYIEF